LNYVDISLSEKWKYGVCSCYQHERDILPQNARELDQNTGQGNGNHLHVNIGSLYLRGSPVSLAARI